MGGDRSDPSKEVNAIIPHSPDIPDRHSFLFPPSSSSPSHVSEAAAAAAAAWGAGGDVLLLPPPSVVGDTDSWKSSSFRPLPC